MTGDTSALGSLHSVDGEGVVRMEDRLDTGIDVGRGCNHRGYWGVTPSSLASVLE
jgi:hypothetical protein